MMKDITPSTTLLKFNMGVLAHNFFDDSLSDEEKTVRCDTIVVGDGEKLVTMAMVKKAIQAYDRSIIVQEQFDSGRSYFFEGWHYHRKTAAWSACWGS